LKVVERVEGVEEYGLEKSEEVPFAWGRGATRSLQEREIVRMLAEAMAVDGLLGFPFIERPKGLSKFDEKMTVLANLIKDSHRVGFIITRSSTGGLAEIAEYHEGPRNANWSVLQARQRRTAFERS
jgi:hypothetical protein